VKTALKGTVAAAAKDTIRGAADGAHKAIEQRNKKPGEE